MHRSKPTKGRTLHKGRCRACPASARAQPGESKSPTKPAASLAKDMFFSLAGRCDSSSASSEPGYDCNRGSESARTEVAGWSRTAGILWEAGSHVWAGFEDHFAGPVILQSAI